MSDKRVSEMTDDEVRAMAGAAARAAATRMTPVKSGYPRAEAEIVADWQEALRQHAAMDAVAVSDPGWAEGHAVNAEKRAALIEEASYLDPMPREVALHVVGMAAAFLRGHAAEMRRFDRPTNATRRSSTAP